MAWKRFPRPALPAIVLFVLAVSPLGLGQAEDHGGEKNVILWTDPGNIGSRNLFWGPGGEEHQPKPVFEFLEEDFHGSNPKFYVRDSQGKKWTVKLGVEAKPETAASRLIWAVGYPANENYFLPLIHVNNMPAHLRRGNGLAGHGGDVPNVRLQRRPDKEKRVGNWNWRHNPFYGTREFNGLRVLMGLIANWDLNDENNAILEQKGDSDPKVYEVSDVGTAFGTPGKSFSDRASKGNLAQYEQTKLIARTDAKNVDLNFPKRPSWLALPKFQWVFFFHELRMLWVGKHIPRADAKWIGSLLSQLTPAQISDAFRAAGYSPAEVDAYTQAVISRIQELNRL